VWQSFKQGNPDTQAGPASTASQLPCHRFERLNTVHGVLSAQAPSCSCDTTAGLVLSGLPA